jgi:hypothetical protein
MTLEEFEKLKFHFVYHMNYANVHTTEYADESGRLGYMTHTRVKSNFETGRTYTHYIIDNKVYKNKEKFVEALAEFNFNEIPEEGKEPN